MCGVPSCEVLSRVLSSSCAVPSCGILCGIPSRRCVRVWEGVRGVRVWGVGGMYLSGDVGMWKGGACGGQRVVP